MNTLATQAEAALLERVVVGGDLSKLTTADRLLYYKAVCESVGLNPLTRPFEYLSLSGRLVMYAKREATDQLRSLHGVSITRLERDKHEDGLYTVTAYATDKSGRNDAAIGAVDTRSLRGDQYANAIMKAETKAKRRVTLSLCGLGLLDESEADSVPGATLVPSTVVDTQDSAPPSSSASSTPDGTDDRTSLIALLNDEMAKWRKKPTEQETWTLIAAFSGGEGDPAKLDPAMLSDILATFRKCTNQDAAAIRQVKAALGWK